LTDNLSRLFTGSANRLRRERYSKPPQSTHKVPTGWQIDSEVEQEVLHHCGKYRIAYENVIKTEAFRDRSDFTETDLERFKSLTAKAVLKEAERIVFDGARADLKRVERAAK
jgi:hypothetical protein